MDFFRVYVESDLFTHMTETKMRVILIEGILLPRLLLFDNIVFMGTNLKVV